MGGYATIGDGGGGTWFWNAEVTTGDNGATIVVPDVGPAGSWNRVFDTEVNVLWWGADATGASDSTIAFQNAVSFLKNTSNADIAGKSLFVPAGYYLVACTEPNSIALVIDVGIHMRGEGGYLPRQRRNPDPVQRLPCFCRCDRRNEHKPDCYRDECGARSAKR